METGRNNDDGISGRQLRELLRSLPAAHAPEDLELNLLYRIAANESYPHRSRPRIPRARVRAAVSESARRTRGYDRIRGLAAAALAALMLAGSWTLYTDPAEQIPMERPVARPLEMMAPVDGSPNASNSTATQQKKRPATTADREPTVVVNVTTTHAENNAPAPAADVAPAQSPVASEKVRERESSNPPMQMSSPLDPAPTVIRASPSGTHVAPGTHTPSGAQAAPADTTTAAPAPPAGNPGIGTGGEPAETIENQSH